MKERPIIFSPPMVRAILDGRKFQTRRIVKVQPETALTFGHTTLEFDRMSGIEARCPYGLVGDQLWVRETYYPAFRRTETSSGCVYKADDDGRHLNLGWSPNGNGKGWKPSIFMPRWASRLQLLVCDVAVERLQIISERDAECEGFALDLTPKPGKICYASARDAFAATWDKLNGRGAWAKNPWVWAIGFKPVVH